MEPIDSNLEYIASENRDPRKRFNWLYIFPALGVLWLLYLLLSVIFQLPASGIIDPVMSFVLVLFFVVAGLMFWALAPKENRQ
ncbi:MAG TPA: hypothetical protein VH593_31095 [Ktedonobacteraceae bacterium]|jgi:hypothetical protein